MEDKKTCPYCGSSNIRLREGIVRARTVPVEGGGPGVERTYPLYHCLSCGLGFDESEAGEGLDPEGPELFR